MCSCLKAMNINYLDEKQSSVCETCIQTYDDFLEEKLNANGLMDDQRLTNPDKKTTNFVTEILNIGYVEGY